MPLVGSFIKGLRLLRGHIKQTPRVRCEHEMGGYSLQRVVQQAYACLALKGWLQYSGCQSHTHQTQSTLLLVIVLSLLIATWHLCSPSATPDNDCRALKAGFVLLP
jgi:hypothetical protein